MRWSRGVFLLAAFGVTTWLLVARGGERVLACQNPIDPTALSGEYDSRETAGFFEQRLVVVPREHEDRELVRSVLGAAATAKRIEVDLSAQRLYAFEGDQKVFEFPISSGKPWWPTPTGTFRIWIKLRYAKMEGGSKSLGTYYYLPNVPYIMYFSNERVPQWKGYGLHGAYWHNNFGVPMSHGCVNLRPDDAGRLFHWVENFDIPVVIYGKTPGAG